MKEIDHFFLPFRSIEYLKQLSKEYYQQNYFLPIIQQIDLIHNSIWTQKMCNQESFQI